jgi:hypothetical protein
LSSSSPEGRAFQYFRKALLITASNCRKIDASR